MATGIQLAVFTGVASLVHWQATFASLAVAGVLTLLLRSLFQAARKAGASRPSSRPGCSTPSWTAWPR